MIELEQHAPLPDAQPELGAALEPAQLGRGGVGGELIQRLLDATLDLTIEAT